MLRFSLVVSSTFILAASGCASLPNGPSVMVLPGTGVTFERFRNDDVICQQYASFQVGGTTANEAAMKSGATSAVVGTALGAAAGAAIGGGSGAAIGGGSGAAIGAGSGLVAGSLVGTGAASSSMYALQDRFDIAYIQCMYAKGHQVPVSGQFSTASPPQVATPPVHIPPPPPGAPPSAPQR